MHRGITARARHIPMPLCSSWLLPSVRTCLVDNRSFVRTKPCRVFCARRTVYYRYVWLGRKFREPERIEVVVESLPIHELLVSAGFRDTAFVEDDNAIGALDGGEAVGDD